MRQQDKIVLVDYLVSAFICKVVLDKLCNVQPWRRQWAKLDTPAFRLNLFPWQEEIMLGIKDDMFVAEKENAIGWETWNMCYILLCN